MISYANVTANSLECNFEGTEVGKYLYVFFPNFYLLIIKI